MDELTQPLKNLLDAAAAGMLAAVFWGRKHPVKLFLSGLVAAFAGYMWGGAACEITMLYFFDSKCTMNGYKAFSSAIGVFSWPLFLLVPQIPDIVKKRASK